MLASKEETKIDEIADRIIETIKKRNGQLLLAYIYGEIAGFVSFYIDDDVLNFEKYVYFSDLVVAE